MLFINIIKCFECSKCQIETYYRLTTQFPCSEGCSKIVGVVANYFNKNKNIRFVLTIRITVEYNEK